MGNTPLDTDAVLAQVLRLPPAMRAAALDDACGADTALREELQRLVREADDADPWLTPGGALQGPFGADLMAQLSAQDGLDDGVQMGPFRILRELGRGGMGVVYLAERADGGFAQQVALKVLKRGLETDEVLARFRQERQILASLTHPNIARLLDGGMTADERPYFAMELVEGEPIDQYCARAGLDIRARVDLCIAVARAVQYAHRHLVIHRDLKPSNVLITTDGEIKLLDFGIAKLMASDAAAVAAPQTRTIARMMTPEYASPEQIRGGAITTASDVYQLGLMLYEVLTGTRAQPLHGLDAAAADRVVCDTEPRRPSTVVTDPRLRRQLSGELDTIVLTALQKEPERRYPSVEALIADLVDYREGRPISARAPSLAYRARKFIGRHRVASAATAAGLVLICGIVGFYSMRLATERDIARREAATATRVADFVTTLFSQADPMRSESATLPARELLRRGAERVDVELASEPDVQARMMSVIGGVYLNIGLYADAQSLLERALAIRRERLPVGDPEIADTLHQLGSLHEVMGRLEPAERALDEALRIRLASLGPAHPDVGRTLNRQGVLQLARGRHDEARALLERALAIHTAAFDPWHDTIAQDLNNLAMVHIAAWNLDEARDALERVIAIRERNLGAGHYLVAVALGNLADVQRKSGDLAGARPRLERALAIVEKTLGPDHRNTATFTNGLANLYVEMKMNDEARTLFERAIAVQSKALGANHSRVAYPTENLGKLHQAMGDHQSALAMFERALEIRVAAYGEDHPEVSQTLESLGVLRLEMGDWRDAEAALRRAVEITKKTFEPGHGRLGRLGSALGACLIQTGRFEEAERVLAEAVEILHARYGESSPDTQLGRQRVAALYAAWGRPAP
jgi:tetratricopeptide (TPR) repeat protein